MSYNKTNWKTGDVISAEKLNNIEDGIAGAGAIPDWNQNDENADDYIKNRPFYKGEENIVTLIPETTITVTEGEVYLEVEDGGTVFNIAKDNVGKLVKIQYNDVIEYGKITFTDDVELGPYCDISSQNVGIYMDHITYQISVYGDLDTENIIFHASIDNTEINKISSEYLPILSIEGTGASSIILNGSLSGCNATGNFAVAEGNYTTASRNYSHAEGYHTTASGNSSHAEGFYTIASGDSSHAEGVETQTSGAASHAEGRYTIANHKSQHVFGEYNIADPSSAVAVTRGTYVEIVGNGASNSARSNARTLDWSGNEALQGSLTLGVGTADETTITAAQLKALLAMLS